VSLLGLLLFWRLQRKRSYPSYDDPFAIPNEKRRHVIGGDDDDDQEEVVGSPRSEEFVAVRYFSQSDNGRGTPEGVLGGRVHGEY
jgi:hypothetical protein